MKLSIKRTIKGALGVIVNTSRKTQIGQYIHNLIVNLSMDQIVEITHEECHLKFVVPNSLCYWRAKTFSTKEPETLEWIDSMPQNALLWDVGANIGLYSVYAAKKRNCRVWAFEPSVFNLELLARNIFANGLTEQVCIVPLALSDQLRSSQMHITSTEWGGALSTFDKSFGWDGKTIRQVFEFQTMGLSMEDAVEKLLIPKPDYIKMDVDGLEHFILKGGTEVLLRIKGILIEINDDFNEQAEHCYKLLSEAGLVLKEKRHSEIIENSTAGFQNSYNQIWIRT